MAAKKKNNSSKQSIERILPNPSQPYQLTQFLNGIRDLEILNHVRNLGSTKLRLRETCRGINQLRLWPDRFYLLDDSPYNSLCITIHLRRITNDTFVSRLYPSRNAEIASKFGPVSSHQRNSNPLTIYLRLSGVPGPSLVSYTSIPGKRGSGNQHECNIVNYECNIIDLFDAKRKPLYFTSTVQFEDIVFALSMQGALAIMKEIDSRLTITAISSARAVPSVSWRFYKEYLVELKGEILLVFLINQKTVMIVDKVEVFHLCFPDLKWIKVERIQGTTLFLEQYNLGVHSGETGSKRNCIYFTKDSDNSWLVYEMETGFILPASEDKKQ